MNVVGAIERVMLRGKAIVCDGTFAGKRGDGRYLRRRASSLTRD